MNARTKVFIAAVAVAAFLMLLAYWPWTEALLLSSREFAGLACIIIIASVSEALAFHFGTGHTVTASLSFLPFLAIVVLFPAPAAVVAVALTVLASNVYPVRRALWKAVFNVSQAALATGIGATAYRFIAGTNSLHLGGFAVLVLLFLLVNLALTSTAIALLQGDPVLRVFREVVGRKGSNVLFDVFASPFALVLVLLYQQIYIWGLVVALAPLQLIRVSYVYNREVRRANRDLLKVLVKAIETRDPYTSGHSVRVATLARVIAEDLKLSETKIDEVEQAALLHDIGKIDPSYAEVISKPHYLTPEERTLISTHSEMGARLLEELTTLSASLVAAVRHHHEKYDGTGYPAGLVGEAIPLAARIIMLCDAIDAMLSDRPYRNALPLESVQAEMVRCAGTQFDPRIVRVVVQNHTLLRAVALVEESRSLRPADRTAGGHFVPISS